MRQLVVLVLKTAMTTRAPADESHFCTMTKGANANFQHHTFYETAPEALNCDQCSSHE